MGITTYTFVFIFLPITIIGWRLLLHIKYKDCILSTLFLSTMSLLFIGSYDYRFVIILFLTVVINFYIVKFICILKKIYLKRIFQYILITGNLSVLLLLKYANWIRTLIETTGQPWKLLLPIGISFYTLEQIMYIIDSCNDNTYHYSFLDYISYSAFFPVIVSGPIYSHSQYMEQLKEIKIKKISNEKTMQGIISFSLGFGKKVLLASQLGRLVDFGYENIEIMSAYTLMLCIIAYSLQLYFDFSGYCNIMEGIGLMMGFELPINFTSPYKAASIGEFWKKWHITLTKFLTHYVYIPLGGNRKGKYRYIVNVLLVFLISGIWHGAELTYVLWGGVHGICIILDRYLKPSWNKLWVGLRKIITFLTVSILWIPFRAESLASMVAIFKGLGNFKVITPMEFYQTMLPRTATLIKASGLLEDQMIFGLQKVLIVVFIIVLLYIVFNVRDVAYLRTQYLSSIWMSLICGIILSFSIMQLSEIPVTFIYEGF